MFGGSPVGLLAMSWIDSSTSAFGGLRKLLKNNGKMIENVNQLMKVSSKHHEIDLKRLLEKKWGNAYIAWRIALKQMANCNRLGNCLKPMVKSTQNQ